jgi:hypothetical protein
VEETVRNDGDLVGSMQPIGFLDGAHQQVTQAPGRQLPIIRIGSPYQIAKQSYLRLQIYGAYRFKHGVKAIVTQHEYGNLLWPDYVFD